MEDLPPPIKIYEKSKPEDEPLIKQEFRINNPFSSFFKWIKEFIKKQSSVTIKIPVIGILVTLSSFGLGLGSGYNWGVNAALSKFFPDSSPILHRAISLEGTIQKSSSVKYYLKSGDNSLWTLKPVNPAINFADYTEKVVKVTGNLTKEKLVIDVSEIIPLETSTSEGRESNGLSSKPSWESFRLPSARSAGPPEVSPAVEAERAVEAVLPQLFSLLQWEKTQKRVLIFTSGKRKIEQEGIYLESTQIASFPQEFINYYIQELQGRKFKETLNSVDPDGITITYSKDDLFLTFGTKNIYSGQGEKKKLTGYRAFIEHN